MEIKTLTTNQLYTSLVDYNLEDPWEKYNQFSKFKFAKGSNLTSNSYKDQIDYLFCLFENDEIIGILKLKTGGDESLSYPGYKNWLSFIEIDEKYQGKGYSKLLIDTCMKFCSDKKFHIIMSGYTDKGWERSRKKFHNSVKKYNIKLIDDHISPTF